MNHSIGTILVTGGNVYLGSMLVTRLTQSVEQAGQGVVYGDIRDSRVLDGPVCVKKSACHWELSLHSIDDG